MNNATPRQALKSKENCTPLQQLASSTSERFFHCRKMQRSISPSATMYSTDDDCVVSQSNTIIEQTAALTHTSNCGRPGCTVVFVYSGATDWPTVNRLVNEHYPLCTGGIRGLAFSHPPSNTHSTRKRPNPPQHGHRNNFIAGHIRRRKSKRNKKEGERKAYLENDEYTANVRPRSVKCRGCGKVIRLDKRSRYYPGLWDKHRGKCPTILRLEVS